jgi:hypothetical protein
MQPLRNSRRAAGAAFALATLAVAACSDAPSAPLAPSPAGSASQDLLPLSTQSRVVSQVWKGDTVVTVFVLGSVPKEAKFGLGHGHKITFPNAAASVCDLLTSSYGAGTWDQGCLPSLLPVQITAKAWFDANGLPRTDFQPAMRFVPGAANAVTLALHDRAGNPSAAGKVAYCSDAGACVDEAVADPSLATQVDPTNGFWVRRIKHFSGYTVIVGFGGDESSERFDRAAAAARAARAAGYITTTGIDGDAERPDGIDETR